MKWIGLDVGSTSMKCYRVDPEYDRVEEIATRPTPAPGSDCPAGRHEIDAERLVQGIYALLDFALEGTPDTSGLLLSAQMHGFVWQDGTNARFISWQDAASLEAGPSGIAHLESLRSAIPSSTWQRTGIPLRPKLAVSNLYARLESGWKLTPSTSISPLDAYILERLTGNAVSHSTMAAATGLADAETAVWLPDILQAIGLEGRALPPIQSGFSLIGIYAHGEQAIPVYPALGDHQACLLGSGAKPMEDINVNIGTGGVLGQIIPQFDPSATECRPFLHGQFIRTVTSLPGGRHLDQLADALAAIMPRGAIWPFLVNPIHGQEPHALVPWKDALQRLQAPITPFDAPEIVRQFYAAFARVYASAIEDHFPDAQAIAFSGGAAERNPALRAHLERATGLASAPIQDNAIGQGFLHMAKMAALST